MSGVRGTDRHKFITFTHTPARPHPLHRRRGRPLVLLRLELLQPVPRQLQGGLAVDAAGVCGYSFDCCVSIKGRGKAIEARGSDGWQMNHPNNNDPKKSNPSPKPHRKERAPCSSSSATIPLWPPATARCRADPHDTLALMSSLSVLVWWWRVGVGVGVWVCAFIYLFVSRVWWCVVCGCLVWCLELVVSRNVYTCAYTYRSTEAVAVVMLELTVRTDPPSADARSCSSSSCHDTQMPLID